MNALPGRLDAYLDGVQRANADVRPVGPFTLFVSRAPFPLYARPRHGEPVTPTAADLAALGACCDELGVPLAVEWLEDVTPALGAVAGQAGLAVERYPLLVLTAAQFRPVPPPADVVVAEATTAVGHADARAVAHLAFGDPGTAVGAAGPPERDDLARGSDPDTARFFADDAATGRTVTVTAAAGEHGVVASGSTKPLGGVAEIMGVATLPAFRRRGLGAAVTSALVQAALDRGVDLLMLSADGDAVARVYERVGFRRIGYAGQAARA